jgi:hypothetical protein
MLRDFVSEKILEKNTMAASLSISEGWIPNGPK